jgi:hypothetical protein
MVSPTAQDIALRLPDPCRESDLAALGQDPDRIHGGVLVETPWSHPDSVDPPGRFSTERRSQLQLGGQPAQSEAPSIGSEAHVQAEEVRGPLLSEFRYGTWSRSFRFPVAIERKQLQVVYRDGLLTVTAPKANTVSTVTVKVEG